MFHTTEGTYFVRHTDSDRKPWQVVRADYHHPLAAFHEQREAEAYLAKVLRQRGLTAQVETLGRAA